MTNPDDPHPDSEPRRLASAGNAFERRLLHSSQLDVPRETVRRSALHRSLAVVVRGRASVAATSRRWLGSLRAAAGTVTVAAAASLVTWFVAKEPARTFSVNPEPATTAPSASAQRLEVVRLPSCPGIVAGSGRDPLIDDFEDGNGRILVRDGRSGVWSAYGDGTGQQTPARGDTPFPVSFEKARGASRHGLHLFGERLTLHGAAFRADMVYGKCYDASAYSGIQFWAKGKGRIYVGFLMVDGLEKQWGGLCEKDCYDMHVAPVDLTEEWTLYSVKWNDLSQIGFGEVLAFDPRRISSLQLQVRVPDTPFDFWVDDIAFTTRR